LDGGQQQRYQNADDRDHDQQLDERKRAHTPTLGPPLHGEDPPEKQSAPGDWPVREIRATASQFYGRTAGFRNIFQRKGRLFAVADLAAPATRLSLEPWVVHGRRNKVANLA
jgi:hypothetical protein